MASTLPRVEGLRVPDYLDQSTHDSLLASVDLGRGCGRLIAACRFTAIAISIQQVLSFVSVSFPHDRSRSATPPRRVLPSVPDQMVANDYKPGSGIFAHIDQAAR
jgi:hypothetical protein